MKTLTWFTHTNIDTRNIINKSEYFTQNQVFNPPSVSVDLSEFIEIFRKNKIWSKEKYRQEYNAIYQESDFNKIKSIKINLHSYNSPYSNNHNYEVVLKSYFPFEQIERTNIFSSGITEASRIAVVIVEFESENKVIDYLTYEEEKNIDLVFENRLSSQNIDSWHELNRIKSIICEFIQFYLFNIHLNFLTINYGFTSTDKTYLTGFTTVFENEKIYFEIDKIDFFGHYVLFEGNQENLLKLMKVTSEFWHKEIPSIHFFLDALKGNIINATNFIKLVFTLESFFTENTSTDFIILSISQILGNDIAEMKDIHEKLIPSFKFRNQIVHGGKIHNITFDSTFKWRNKNLNTSNLFFELKNIIIKLFYFYVNEGLYLNTSNEKINHELLFRYIPVRKLNKK